MPRAVDALVRAALQLTDDDRMFLVERLLEGLSGPASFASANDPGLKANLIDGSRTAVKPVPLEDLWNSG